MEAGKELTKEEILNLPEKSEFVIYNPLTDTYRFEKTGKNDIAHNKHAYEGLVYFEVITGLEGKKEIGE